MLCLRARFCKLKWNPKYMALWSSSSSTMFPEICFQPKFSTEEQEKILSILNGSTTDKLLGLNVAQSKIKNLESYKKRKGPFKSLDELLEVDGLSVKMLEKLCRQLITDTPGQIGKTQNNEYKKIKQLLVPSLPPITNDLKSSVGIHLASMGISWAKINRCNNELEYWGHQDFGNLPKKLCPTDTFKLAMNILYQIPSADLYVFEGANGTGAGQKASSSITTYSPQLELSSMLLALINTSKYHNKGYLDDTHKYEEPTNCVYFLKAKCPARLFKTLVGNECVSNTNTILQLLGDSPPDTLALPCTPITVEPTLKNEYLAQSSAHKELLGQALMLTIAFTDLCIIKNPVSIKAFIPGKK